MKFIKKENDNFQKMAKTGLLVLTSAFFAACSSDDDSIPEIINEEELITTMKVSLVPENGGETLVLNFQDLDGDGSNEPIIDSEILAANTVYSGTILLLNETTDPAENITLEVAEEGEAHQFFYSNNAGMITNYTDEDSNGNPIGINFSLETSAATSGSLTIILRHEPNKSAEGVIDGNIENAGGETDILVTFPISVE